MIVQNLVKAKKSHPNSKLAVFIRHGEKSLKTEMPALITEQAKLDIKLMAKELTKLNFDIRFYSSPELRCVETAKIYNEITSNSKNIVLSSFLGDPGVQVKDLDCYLELYYQKGARSIYQEWTNSDHYNVLKPPHLLNKELNEFLRTLPRTNDVTILISQSLTIATLEHSLGIRDYDISKDQWVPYLDGFVIPY